MAEITLSLECDNTDTATQVLVLFELLMLSPSRKKLLPWVMTRELPRTILYLSEQLSWVLSMDGDLYESHKDDAEAMHRFEGWDFDIVKAFLTLPDVASQLQLERHKREREEKEKNGDV